MSTLHIIIQKSLLSLFALCFVFVTIYVPQSWNKIQTAEAAFATTHFQALQLFEETGTLVMTTFTKISTLIQQWYAASIWSKEIILDGFAWWAIKLVIAQITRSIVNWINSGFQGMPSFVQDLNGFLLGVGTQIAGVYLQQLGMPALTAFICAPFRLNIQIAFATNYRRAMSPYPYGTTMCRIDSGILGGFVGGSFNGSTPGSGWGNWINVTTQSNTYTPYGSLMASQHEASLQMRTAISVQNRYLQFGQGFFSNMFCEAVANPSFTYEKCMVSTPGNVISEALNFQLSAGVRSMIAADEINEIIGALMGQVAQTALMGVNGLLGMSSNTGYTDPKFPDPYLDRQVSGQQDLGATTMNKYLQTIDAQIATENNYITLIDSAIPLLNLLGTTDSVAEALRATELRPLVAANIVALEKIKTDLLSGIIPVDQIIADYTKLDLHSDTQVKDDENNWLGMFITLYTESVRLVELAQGAIGDYRPRLIINRSLEAMAQVNLMDNTYSPALTAHKTELDKIAIDWNNLSISKVDVLQHFIDLKDGTITGTPLYTLDQYTETTTAWDDILN